MAPLPALNTITLVPDDTSVWAGSVDRVSGKPGANRRRKVSGPHPGGVGWTAAAHIGKCASISSRRAPVQRSLQDAIPNSNSSPLPPRDSGSSVPHAPLISALLMGLAAGLTIVFLLNIARLI